MLQLIKRGVGWKFSFFHLVSPCRTIFNVRHVKLELEFLFNFNLILIFSISFLPRSRVRVRVILQSYCHTSVTLDDIVTVIVT